MFRNLQNFTNSINWNVQEDQRNQVYTIAWFAREQQNRFPSTCTGSNAKTSPRYGCRTEIFRETSARHARAHRINSGRADRLAPTCHGELTDFKSNRFGREPETAGFLRGRKNTVRFPQEGWGWFRFPGQPPERNFWREARVFFSPHVTPKYQPTLQHGSFFLSAWNLCQEFRRIIKVRFSSYLGNLHGRGFLPAFVACFVERIYGATVTRNVRLDIWKRETVCLAATRSFLFIVNQGYVYEFIGSFFSMVETTAKKYIALA